VCCQVSRYGVCFETPVTKYEDGSHLFV